MAKKDKTLLVGADSWTRTRRLGAGGHGEVWAYESAEGEERAFKVVQNLDSETLHRLRNEVQAQRELAGVAGVMPIFDAYIPETPDAGPAWISMPVAVPLEIHLKGATLDARMHVFRTLAECLAEIHAKGYAHRDIKPDNILFLDGQPVFSDFGLVELPVKSVNTPKGKRIGNFATIAPEMRRKNSGAKGGPADVFSFGKTLWMTLVEDEEGFDGEYAHSTRERLRSMYQSEHIGPIDKLIGRTTRLSSAERPSMSEVLSKIEQWLAEVKDFEDRARAHWIGLNEQLVPESINRATWTDVGHIEAVLKAIAAATGIHHALLPDGGGQDLEGVKRLEGELFLDVGDGVDIHVRPRALHFCRYASAPESNFFYLELSALPRPVGQPESKRRSLIETYTRFSDGTLAAPDHYFDGQWEGKPIPEGTTSVRRAYGGAILLVMRASPYNRDPGTYDGRHSKAQFDDFVRHYESEYVAPDNVHVHSASPRFHVEDESWKTRPEGKIGLNAFKEAEVREIVNSWPKEKASSGEWGGDLAAMRTKRQEESRAFDRLFSVLSDQQIVELCSLMYLGRDTRGERVIATRWQSHAEYFARDPRYELIRAMREKSPAAKYISDGLESLGYGPA